MTDNVDVALAELDRGYALAVGDLLARHGVEHWLDLGSAGREEQATLDRRYMEAARVIHGRDPRTGELTPAGRAIRREAAEVVASDEASDDGEEVTDMATATKGRVRKVATSDLVKRNAQILQDRKAGMKPDELAVKYGLSVNTIGAILWRERGGRPGVRSRRARRSRRA